MDTDNVFVFYFVLFFVFSIMSNNNQKEKKKKSLQQEQQWLQLVVRCLYQKCLAKRNSLVSSVFVFSCFFLLHFFRFLFYFCFCSYEDLKFS